MSEIAIKPVESKTYLRLVLVIYLLTTFLIFYSSLFFPIKLILIGFLAFLLRTDLQNKSPNNGIKEIQLRVDEWVLLLNDGKKQRYQEAQILINNALFQLIRFKTQAQTRLIVLFHDQVPEQQRRMLHLKIAQN